MNIDLNCDIKECSKEQIKKLEKEVKKLQNEIEEKQKLIEDFKNMIWPEKGNEYYELIADGCIDHSVWEDTRLENDILQQGHIFRTLSEAEREKDKRIVLTKLKKYADKNGEWVIAYRSFEKKPGVFRDCDISDRGLRYLGMIYFSSEEMAKDAIVGIGEENILKLFD